METGILTDPRLGGTTVVERTDSDDGLPADVERTEGVYSVKFRPNYIHKYSISLQNNNQSKASLHSSIIK